MKKLNKKGVSLSEFPVIAMTVVLAITLLGAGILAVNSFKTTDCQFGANALKTACLNSTGGTAGAPEGLLFNSTTQGANLLLNTSGQFPVVGTIIGVSLLIFLVVAGFMFGKDRGFF